MALYQLLTVDTPKFEQFFNAPANDQLASFAKRLSEDPQANDFFTEDLPAWQHDPVTWLSSRFRCDDWYGDLTEPEMVAWDHAMQSTLELPEMQSSHPFTALPVDGIPTCLFDFAAEAIGRAGEDAAFLSIRPYRLRALPPEVQQREPYERIYWPGHGVVTPQDARRMLQVFGRYDELVSGLQPRDPRLARQLKTEGADAAQDIPHLVTFLRELNQANATWFARLDC